MSWIGYAVFGLVAGALARLIHPGKDSMNWVWTMLLGIAGASVGGWIGGMVGVGTQGGLMSWVAAVGGAVLLLWAYHAITTRTAGTTTSVDGPATSDDYKKAVLDDLSQGPR